MGQYRLKRFCFIETFSLQTVLSQLDVTPKTEGGADELCFFYLIKVFWTGKRFAFLTTCQPRL